MNLTSFTSKESLTNFQKNYFAICFSIGKIIFIYGIYFSLVICSLHNTILIVNRNNTDGEKGTIIRVFFINTSVITMDYLGLFLTVNFFGLFYSMILLFNVTFLYGASYYNQLSIAKSEWLNKNINSNLNDDLSDYCYKRIIREAETICFYKSFGTSCIGAPLIFITNIVRSMNFGNIRTPIYFYHPRMALAYLFVSLLFMINNCICGCLAECLEMVSSNIYSFGVLYGKGFFDSAELDLYSHEESKSNVLKNFCDIDYLLYFMHYVIFLCLKQILCFPEWVTKEHGDWYFYYVYLSLYAVFIVCSAVGSLVGGSNNMQIVICSEDPGRYEKYSKIQYMVGEYTNE